MAKPTPKTGKKTDWMAVIGGLLGILGLIIVFLADKKNKFAMSYAKQSAILNILVIVLSAITLGIGGLILGPINILISLWLAYQAYLGNNYKLPVIGDWADQLKI